LRKACPSLILWAIRSTSSAVSPKGPGFMLAVVVLAAVDLIWLVVVITIVGTLDG